MFIGGWCKDWQGKLIENDEVLKTKSFMGMLYDGRPVRMECLNP